MDTSNNNKDPMQEQDQQPEMLMMMAGEAQSGPSPSATASAQGSMESQKSSLSATDSSSELTTGAAPDLNLASAMALADPGRYPTPPLPRTARSSVASASPSSAGSSTSGSGSSPTGYAPNPMMMMGGPSGPGATPAWYPSPTLQEDWTQHFAQQQAQQQMQMQLQHQMQQQFAKDFRWDQLSKEEQAAHLQQAQLQVQQQQAHQQQSRLFMPQSMMYAQSPMFANHGNNAQTGNASVAQAMMMRGPPPPTPLHMLSMLADTERHVPVPSSAEGQPSSANTVGTHSPPPSSPTTEAPSLRAPPVGRKKRAEASNAQSLVSPPMSYAKSKRTVETYDEADSSRFLCPHPDCGKSFTRAQNLASHMTVHSGVKPFGCGKDGCQAQFRRRQDLFRHIRSIHEPISARPYECPTEGCHMRFARADGLSAHAKKCGSRASLKMNRKKKTTYAGTSFGQVLDD